ncbi:ribokinase [Planomicrobium sp. YIM 101495]|uniref:ribokinase n=1 Tax=Planomicrobium sp. YIM 101495 TaxID=2665160 RepID=UPI0012B93568|nr:ribokinase [Planomicrobium sp. YIM 101495]MTD31962.1 ribokinase [Planomicrobium sp. YIM 101495]
MDIAVIGSNMVDLITYMERMPEEGETLEAPEFEMGCGGKGANQAIAAGRLGSDVLMVTKVGNDLFGQNTIENFKNNGIRTEAVEVGTRTSGVAPIFVDPHAKNRILIIQGANNELRPESLEQHRPAIKEVKLIILQLEIPLETVYAAIDMGVEMGIPVLLNPAPANPELDIEYVKKCTYFAPNESELGILTGLPVSSLAEIKAAAATLVDKGVNNMIVTMGDKGVLWMDGQNELVIEGKKVDAIDTTGAGDSFIGCFAHYLTKGESIEYSLGKANLYAAQAVQKRGTQSSYPTKQEFTAY